MQMRRRSRAPLMVLLAVIALAGTMVAVAPFAAAHNAPGPLAAVDFTAAWTNDDGTGGDGDDGGPFDGKYDAWGAASSADPAAPGAGADRADKDVAICTAAVSPTDPNRLNVTVFAAYPGYHCTFYATVSNGSALPATVEAAVLSADPGLVLTPQDPQLPATLGPGDEAPVGFAVQVLQMQNQNSVMHAAVTITITADWGYIIVDKVTDAPGSPLEFEFEPSWGDNFFLTDDDDPHNSGLLEPGVYSVTEVNLPEDWILTDASCVVEGDPSATPMDPEAITLGSAQTVICTFENFDTGQLGPNPSLVIIKDARPADDTVFWFDGGTLPSFSLQDPSNSTKQFTDLEPGEYTITELAVGLDDTWQFEEVECDALDWEADGPSVTLNLSQGEVAVCTFYNAEELPPTGAPPWTLPVVAGGLTSLLAGLALLLVWRRGRKAEA